MSVIHTAALASAAAAASVLVECFFIEPSALIQASTHCQWCRCEFGSDPIVERERARHFGSHTHTPRTTHHPTHPMGMVRVGRFAPIDRLIERRRNPGTRVPPSTPIGDAHVLKPRLGRVFLRSTAAKQRTAPVAVFVRRTRVDHGKDRRLRSLTIIVALTVSRPFPSRTNESSQPWGNSIRFKIDKRDSLAKTNRPHDLVGFVAPSGTELTVNTHKNTDEIRRSDTILTVSAGVYHYGTVLYGTTTRVAHVHSRCVTSLRETISFPSTPPSTRLLLPILTRASRRHSSYSVHIPHVVC